MEPENKNIINVDINKEMKEAYLQYSMSVIVGRALPDVRDGLKPVHRRILFAMKEMGNYHNKPYKKSARVVGDVIGKYHPHGDTAVYDTAVRMAQDFSLRYPLIDGQGNFGSIDGDSPAAMRYTEIRMTKLAEELLNDIDKETVAFGPNYDDSLEIPLVLPAKFPNLLVNGSSGIAVGMATNIPPHNLGEVIDGCIEIIKNPNCGLADLLQHIKGPDFPTAGVIAGKSGILDAYKTGRGGITLKAVSEIETYGSDRERIVVTEIPYQVNKSKLIESIADLVRDKKIEGVSDIRDESSREGMRIVIDVKRGETASVVMNRLYKFTQMETRFGIILLALDKGSRPKIFNLKEALEAFVHHRREVVTKRCIFDLKKAEARIHILMGLKMALDNIDDVVATIRKSPDAQGAKIGLITKFSFSEIQAQAILDMRLQRLTGLERQKIIDEVAEIEKEITWLKMVLGDVKEIYKIIVQELEEIKKSYSNPRKTQIVQEESEDMEDEDLIQQENVMVTITNSGYIKRIPVETYRAQRRGGKGLKGVETREEDFVTNIFTASTHTTLLVFTDKGKVYWCKVHRLPAGNRQSKGKAIANVVQLAANEKVQAILPIEEFTADKFVVLVTKNGIIKKTSLDNFSNPRPSGIIALTTDLDDSLICAQVTSGKDDIFVATREGMSIRFSEEETRPMGRTARGVKAVTLGKGDHVIGCEIITPDCKKHILMVTGKGYGKRSETSEYRTQGRGGVGIITQKTSDKVGEVISTILVSENEDVMLMTDKGQVIRIKCNNISLLGRNTQGVKLINVNESEIVSSVAKVAEEDEAETGEPSSATIQ
ncbi:MAG: DNA gyrase subunit A [Bdellovibrionota bacterium]